MVPVSIPWLIAVVALIVLATVLLAVAISMQDLLLTFVCVLVCLGLVGMLFRRLRREE